MTDKQIERIKDQLPLGSTILRMYRAFEGDLRLIVKGPQSPNEVRYSIVFEGDYPRIKLMP